MGACSSVATLTTIGTWAIQPEYPAVAEVLSHKLNGLARVNQPYWGKYDRASFNFDTDIDLSTEYNWNVKLLFVWVTAEWTDSKGVDRLLTVWDRIIHRPEQAKLHLKKEKMKYV